MDDYSDSDNYIRFNKLNEFFKDKIKLAMKTEEKIFISTKNDTFYEIDVYGENIQSFLSNDDNSLIENMIVPELCSKKIIDLSYGYQHYIARTENKQIYCWGNNYLGQLGNGKSDNDSKSDNKPELNRLLSELNIISIKCGDAHSLALTQNGEVYAWGWNRFGQIGVGSDDEILTIPFKVDGFNGEVAMISCGLRYSLALTKSGLVYSWGFNCIGQLGIGNFENSRTPKLIDMNGISISRISCGAFHSLILSTDGVIYTFGKKKKREVVIGYKDYYQKPAKLNYDKKFIDIDSHWIDTISMARSSDNVFYIWGNFKEDILMPKKTDFKSFNEIFAFYFQNSLVVSDQLIKFSELLFREGFYKKYYNEIEELGEGSYGKVVKVNLKSQVHFCFAIKKIIFKKVYKTKILKEFRNFDIIYKLLSDYVVEHHDAWLESSENKDEIIFYIHMDSCDQTLDRIIDELGKNMRINGSLTIMGYYIASHLFIKILEGVQYLHKHNIIHRDLNPYNIMLKDFNGNDIEGFIRIVDFGLIALHEFAEKTHSADIGQLKFAAPEVLNGEKYDTKADIFSLGKILQRLFDLYDVDDEKEIASTILTSKYVGLKNLFDKMTESSPSARPNCSEILTQKQMWALSQDEFDFDQELKSILDSESSSKDLYIYSILESILIEMNVKIMNNIQSMDERFSFLKDLLLRYKQRPKIARNFLLDLSNWEVTDLELRKNIIEFIVFLMRSYPELFDIQYNSIFCIGMLVEESPEELDMDQLEKVVDVFIKAMKTFPNDRYIHVHGLSIFFNDHILYEVPFDKYEFMLLVMDHIVDLKDEKSLIVAYVCHKIASMLSVEEKLSLCSKPAYMESLLNIVKSYTLSEMDYDHLLHSILCALVNLTDLSPETCELFLAQGGLDIFCFVLNTFADQIEARRNVLILLMNIAEIHHLRENLMKSELILLLRNSMHSSEISISFYATGIIAHLCSEGMKIWSIESLNFNTIVKEIMDVISKWANPDKGTIDIVSFRPFQSLLNCFEFPAVQLFALWTINHLCSINPERYGEMFLEEIGVETVESIFELSKSDEIESISSLCKGIIGLAVKKTEENEGKKAKRRIKMSYKFNKFFRSCLAMKN